MKFHNLIDLWDFEKEDFYSEFDIKMSDIFKKQDISKIKDQFICLKLKLPVLTSIHFKEVSIKYSLDGKNWMEIYTRSYLPELKVKLSEFKKGFKVSLTIPIQELSREQYLNYIYEVFLYKNYDICSSINRVYGNKPILTKIKTACHVAIGIECENDLSTQNLYPCIKEITRNILTNPKNYHTEGTLSWIT